MDIILSLLFKGTFVYLVINGIIQIIKRTPNRNKKDVVLKVHNFSKKSEEDKFVTESAFNKNLEQQMLVTPEVICNLRKLDDDEKELKLEYFFFTNKAEKAEALATEIRKLNYSTSVLEVSEKLFVVTGWTKKIKMTDEVVKKWISQMCLLGYKFDCRFDALGVDQESTIDSN